MEKNAFCWPVRVYYEDTDHGGVVYYANYLRFMERCRTEMLRAKGLEQDQLINDLDLLFAVRRAEVDYLAAAKFNDKLLVSAQIQQSSKVKINFKQSIFRCENDSLPLTGEFIDLNKLENEHTLLCKAEISIVALSASQLRPKRISSDLYERLKHNHNN